MWINQELIVVSAHGDAPGIEDAVRGELEVIAWRDGLKGT